MQWGDVAAWAGVVVAVSLSILGLWREHGTRQRVDAQDQTQKDQAEALKRLADSVEDARRNRSRDALQDQARSLVGPLEQLVNDLKPDAGSLLKLPVSGVRLEAARTRFRELEPTLLAVRRDHHDADVQRLSVDLLDAVEASLNLSTICITLLLQEGPSPQSVEMCDLAFASWTERLYPTLNGWSQHVRDDVA
jgi:hypothetical protein